MEIISCKMGNKTRVPTLIIITKNSFGNLVTAIREGKEIKGIQIGKKEVKLTVWGLFDPIQRKP